MELSNKKYSLIYTVFLIIVLSLFTLLITSRSWYGANTATLSEDYNTVRSIGGYYIKISNAIYLTDTHQLRFTYSVKEISSGSSQGDEPEVLSVWLDTAQNELPFSVGDGKISKNVICNNADDTFKKVIIKIVFREPDKIIEDRYDEFGDVIPGSVEKGEEKIERITIDIKDILFMTSDEAATMTTTKAVMTTMPAASETSTLNTVLTEDSKTTQQSSLTEASSTDKNTSSKTKTEKSTNKSVSSEVFSGSVTADLSSDNSIQQTSPPKQTQEYIPPETQSIKPETTAQKTTTANKTTLPSTTVGKQPVQVNGIRLETGFEANSVILKINQSAVITAVISPSNADDKTVSWSSNRPDIASVDNTGKITGHSSGKAIITAKTSDGGLSASCMVTVSE
ncbi:Ig-like domain-containing protein [Ruminococcus sp. Marseille-P6503]|uniref:Ig-like domain-containing protein n=1 Tax=Ruminococcus sp. Marseille-P6503 TaxID=2364796 RepID=UPI000F542EF8|nr:Ig-like domain-containing protein [Ruminococcus sp. Marseille-P6503]